MQTLGRILLVEDDPRDVELTLTALDEYNLANEVVVAPDGEQALVEETLGRAFCGYLPIALTICVRGQADAMRLGDFGQGWRIWCLRLRLN